MESTNVSACNGVVCGECWEVFLSPVELELHHRNCSRLTRCNKVEEISTKESKSTLVLNKIEMDVTNETSLNSNETSDADLTVLKTMPPAVEDGSLNQNGELLSVFEQTSVASNSAGHINNSLQDFNISLPVQSILGTYIQQRHSQPEHMTMKNEIKNQNNEHVTAEQQRLLPSQEHELLHQSSALLTNNLQENGIKAQLPSTKLEKNTFKRKLLPKSNQLAEFSQMFQCTQCDSIFYNDASYRDHARSHAKVKEFVCEYCGITLTKYEQMTKHLDKEHNSDLSYYCYLCYTPADDKFNLQEHLKYCGKNDGMKNPLLQTLSNSQLLPSLLSGSTMKYSNSKGLISCPKCGQILGNEESLNVQDKASDVQCKFCATIVTLIRQSASDIPQSVISLENKAADILGQVSSASLPEPLLLSAVENQTPTSSQTAPDAPLLLYSQSSGTSLPQINQNNSLSGSSLTTESNNGNGTGISSVSIPAVTVGSPNHMTVGINTSNGLMVLTLPVVTADKVTTDSVTAPVLQLPTGNIILLGSDGGSFPSLSASSPASGGLLQTSLPITTNCVSPVLPTNDILMTAAAGINSPSSPETLYLQLSESQKPPKLKMSRFSCSHCGKMFDTQHSWRRHVQTHVMPKKQHICQICNKIFARPGQLKEHLSKIHTTSDETNKSEVQMIKIKT